MSLQGKKIAILIAPRGTEEPEFVKPHEAVKQAGATVTVIGLEFGSMLGGAAITESIEVDPLGTILAPSGISEMGIILKLAIPSGMPMIVRHIAMPVVRWPMASHSPATINQMTLPSRPNAPVSPCTTSRPNSAGRWQASGISRTC